MKDGYLHEGDVPLKVLKPIEGTLIPDDPASPIPPGQAASRVSMKKPLLILAALIVLVFLATVIVIRDTNGIAPQSVTTAPTGSAIGATKKIRMQVKNEMGLAVFRDKADLERLIVVISKQNAAGIYLLMQNYDRYFYAADNAQVKVVDSSGSDYSTEPLYKVTMLEGPERGSTGWLMAMDVK